MRPTQPYVLLFSDEFFSLIGPFPSSEAAAAGGAKWQAEHGDNPCWQLVELTDEQVASPLLRVSPAE